MFLALARTALRTICLRNHNPLLVGRQTAQKVGPALSRTPTRSVRADRREVIFGAPRTGCAIVSPNRAIATVECDDIPLRAWRGRTDSLVSLARSNARNSRL